MKAKELTNFMDNILTIQTEVSRLHNTFTEFHFGHSTKYESFNDICVGYRDDNNIARIAEVLGGTPEQLNSYELGKGVVHNGVLWRNSKDIADHEEPFTEDDIRLIEQYHRSLDDNTPAEISSIDVLCNYAHIKIELSADEVMELLGVPTNINANNNQIITYDYQGLGFTFFCGRD
jgi:hypothetical protein